MIILILSMVVFWSAASVAAAPAPTSVARPTADLVVTFDTLHAEKAMDGEIWKKIQDDKKRAQKRSRDKSPFKTEGQDIAGVVNVSFVSFNPFRFIADGVLSVSGGNGMSIKDDVDTLAEMAKDSGYAVVKSGGKKTPIYAIDLAEQSDDEGTVFPANGVEFTVLNDTQVRFFARWGVVVDEFKKMREAMTDNAGGGAPPLASALDSAPLSGTALTIVGNAVRFADLPLDGNDEQRSLKDLLRQISTFTISARVDGKVLKLTALLVFKDEESAMARRTEFATDCNQVLSALTVQKSMVQTLTSGGDGRNLTVEATLDIRKAWDTLCQFENTGRRPRKKARNRNEKRNKNDVQN